MASKNVAERRSNFINFAEPDWVRWLREKRERRKLEYLTIDTTAVCDVTCPNMCYYHPAIDLKKRPVDVSFLKESIACAYNELGTRTIVFAGKEPLLGKKTLSVLLEFAQSLNGLTVGIVSNGRNIHRCLPELRTASERGALRFFDVSLDHGIAKQHDAIRGKDGTFALATTGLKELLNIPSLRVGITSVLRHDNADGLLHLLATKSGEVQNFFFSPIQAPPFSPSQPLPWSSIERFFADVIALVGAKENSQGLEIIFSALGVYAFDASSSKVLQDAEETILYGQPALVLSIKNHRLYFVIQSYAETGWNILRITSAGWVLPNTHFLQHEKPEDFALGNIQDASISELYSKVFEPNSVLERIVSSRASHDCKNRECWQGCFGGFSASENSILSNQSLFTKPQLCPKP